MNRSYAALVVIASLAGCSSLVDDPCMGGFHLESGTCVPNNRIHEMSDAMTMEMMMDAGIDAGTTIGTSPDGGLQTLTCDLPTSLCGETCVLLDTDPENCGHCGRECASGICNMGTCVGDIVGHVIVIGHDYAASDPAMDRVVANAVHLGSLTGFAGAAALRVGYWHGSSTLDGGPAAVRRGLQQTGDTALASVVTTVDHAALTQLDAIVIEPQVGDGAAAEQAGSSAATALAEFLVAGHSVVVLETTAGVSYRYLHGAGLGDLNPPIDVSSMAVTVVAPSDSVVTGVVNTYLAKPGSVGFPSSLHTVVTDSTGDAVVIHATY